MIQWIIGSNDSVDQSDSMCGLFFNSPQSPTKLLGIRMSAKLHKLRWLFSVKVCSVTVLRELWIYNENVVDIVTSEPPNW